MKKDNLTKVVFLDRDGTVNPDKNGFINHPDDFELYPFAAEAISLLNKSGYLVLIVTNQSGIAREFYTLEDLEIIHKKMQDSLAEQGAKIDAIYISPYHIEGKLEPYNIDHEDRKPGLGMFKKALKKYNFQINSSFMIGDRYADIAFGKKAGLTTFLVLTGDGKKEFYKNRDSWKYKPDFIVKNLMSAVKLIERLK
ncbi:MAG: HAD family hydrolase [Candidatus Cloacimonetes bacterium]|nr:HAD family hydrolase [Candidatus Cloacimonadota bacterium]